MPITPEQRQVLLDRLKLAREAKDKKKAETLAAKSSAPSAPKDIKSKIKVAPKAKKEPPIVLKSPEPEPKEYEEIPFEEPLPSAPLPSAPKGKVVVLDENHPDIKREIEELHAKKAKAQPAQKQKKDAYAKIVFYKEPSRKKMDTLMKSLHEETSSEEEDDEAAEQHYVPPPRTQRQAVPQQMRHLPQVSDRTEFMRQLARQYYN